MRGRQNFSFDSFDIKKIPFVTIVIILLNVIGLLYELEVGEDVAAYHYAMYEGALEDGEWGRMFMSGFLHFGFYHFASNMACLFFFGMSFERKIGPVRYVIIYIAALVGAGIAVNFFGGQSAIHAGASGGIWGLMGASLILTIKNHQNPIYIGRGIILNLVYSFSAGVSWQGHIGGGIAGFVTAAVVLVLFGRKGDGGNGFRYMGHNGGNNGNDDFRYLR